MRRARAAAIVIALLVLAGCAGAPDATPTPSPSVLVEQSPSPSPSEVAAPVGEPIECRAASSILPVTDPTRGPEALRWDLLGAGSTEIAMVALTVDGTVVTPSTAALDASSLVETAVERLQAAGSAPIAWSLAPAVPWSFDDLCAGMETVFDEMRTGDDVVALGMEDDARLRVGISIGSPVPSIVTELDAAHPGMLRITEEQGSDVGADVG